MNEEVKEYMRDTNKEIELLNKIANGEEVPKKIIGKNSLGKKEEYIYIMIFGIYIFLKILMEKKIIIWIEK